MVAQNTQSEWLQQTARSIATDGRIRKQAIEIAGDRESED
jgi:hypothetical protein